MSVFLRPHRNLESEVLLCLESLRLSEWDQTRTDGVAWDESTKNKLNPREEWEYRAGVESHVLHCSRNLTMPTETGHKNWMKEGDENMIGLCWGLKEVVKLEIIAVRPFCILLGHDKKK